MIELRYQYAVLAQDRSNFGRMLSSSHHLNGDKINGECKQPEKKLLIYTHLFVQKELRGVDKRESSYT